MYKYLVVDDSKMARKMVMGAIKEHINESEIFQATNGQEAVENYKKYSPDLVFMDLTMPVMNGFEAIKLIKDFDSNAKIMVISADIQQGAKDEAKKNGAIGFINKPIDQSKIQGVLSKLGHIDAK